jgi:hypothetical protein
MALRAAFHRGGSEAEAAAAFTVALHEAGAAAFQKADAHRPQ